MISGNGGRFMISGNDIRVMNSGNGSKLYKVIGVRGTELIVDSYHACA
jgi:hypothetical protein